MELCAFCHELRMQDVEDKYTQELLYGQVKPQVLVDIAQSNSWDAAKKEMKVKESDVYVVANMAHQ